MSRINEVIEKFGNEWRVYSKKKVNNRRKLLGTHATREQAVAQLRAIELSKNESQVLTFSQFINERKKDVINPAYLTKDAAKMKSEIKKNAKKDDDDPSAYVSHPNGGWQADYSKSGKRYKTSQSKYTKAFHKKYGTK